LWLRRSTFKIDRINIKTPMRFIRLLGRYINAVVMATHEEYCHKYGDGNVGSVQLKIDEKEHPEDHAA